MKAVRHGVVWRTTTKDGSYAGCMCEPPTLSREVDSRHKSIIHHAGGHLGTTLVNHCLKQQGLMPSRSQSGSAQGPRSSHRPSRQHAGTQALVLPKRDGQPGLSGQQHSLRRPRFLDMCFKHHAPIFSRRPPFFIPHTEAGEDDAKMATVLPI